MMIAPMIAPIGLSLRECAVNNLACFGLAASAGGASGGPSSSGAGAVITGIA